MQTNIKNETKLIRNENVTPEKEYPGDSLNVSSLGKSFVKMSQLGSSFLERSLVIGIQSSHAEKKISLDFKQNQIISQTEKRLKFNVIK